MKPGAGACFQKNPVGRDSWIETLKESERERAVAHDAAVLGDDQRPLSAARVGKS